MTCKVSSTSQGSTETEEFSHIIFSQQLGRDGLIQTWPAIALRTLITYPRPFSKGTLFCDRVSSWVQEELLQWQFALVLKVKCFSQTAECPGLLLGGGDFSLGHGFMVGQTEREGKSWPPYGDGSWQGPWVRWKRSRGVFDHRNWMLQ